MSGGLRSLPSRPSLRYLKLEAKRRLAAGEFAALHDAQVAIAWEHGLPSWTALKQLICGQPQQECRALPQLRWVIARFKDAGEPAWAAPGDDELRQHFDDHLLAAIPAGELVAAITSVAADLREDLVVIGQAPLEARVQIAGLEVFASVEADPPHRLTGLQGYPLGGRITDTRVAAPPPARTLGDVPAEMAGVADGAFAELGLVGLVLAGGGLGLDDPANDHLRTVGLADDTITVRELLGHTAGVDSPTPAELFADTVPDLVTLAGPVIACGGTRGVVRPSNGGYAVLGQLIADVTGSPYADVVTRLVLEPLGMRDSWFPARAADLGPDAVTGYNGPPGAAVVPVGARRRPPVSRCSR